MRVVLGPLLPQMEASKMELLQSKVAQLSHMNQARVQTLCIFIFAHRAAV